MSVAQAYQRGWEAAVIEWLVQFSIVSWLLTKPEPPKPEPVVSRKPLYQMTAEEVRNANRDGKLFPAGWRDRIKMDGGPWDRGAWHRCIDIGREMLKAGVWDGQRVVSIHDAYHVHHLLFGIEKKPVGELIEGTHYSFGPEIPKKPVIVEYYEPGQSIKLGSQKASSGKHIRPQRIKLADGIHLLPEEHYDVPNWERDLEDKEREEFGYGKTLEEMTYESNQRILKAMAATAEELAAKRARGESIWTTRIH